MNNVFEKKPAPPPNYFSRREQYRLLVLCSMLMLVLVMMNEARKPDTWKWMWANEASGSQSQEPLDSEPIDTKVDESDARSIPVGGFRARSANGVTLTKEISGDDFLQGITPELLAAIEDNSVMRVPENEAWQTILRVLAQASESELSQASMGYVSFAQLFRQSEVYRGRVVSIRGTIRRAENISTRDNGDGAGELFRWIVEPAGPSNAPIVVYSLQKPAKFKIGDGLREEATFDGVFFKRWAYAAGDGTRIAPLILAKTANWRPKPVAEPIQLPSSSVTVTTLVTVGLFAMGVALLVYRNSVKQHPDVKRVRRYTSGDVGQFESDTVLPPVEQSLRQLAEHDSPANGHK